jgi:CheY-like chemotaxis protein
MVSRRVLIVDDDSSVLFVLQAALRRLLQRDEVVAVRSGKEALNKAREAPFDLLLTDLRMPGMDGVELTEAIRDMNPEMAVIWITGFGAHNAYRDQERLGVSFCLDKPLEVEEIRTAVRQALA